MQAGGVYTRHWPRRPVECVLQIRAQHCSYFRGRLAEADAFTYGLVSARLEERVRCRPALQRQST